MSEEIPKKYHPGNTLLYEPSGRIHFVNDERSEYYWTALTEHTRHEEKPEGVQEYFGFRNGMPDLYYFSPGSHPVSVDIYELESKINLINEGCRSISEEFRYDVVSSTFWIDFYTGRVYTREKEVEGFSLDFFQIVRTDCRIWRFDKKLNLKFSKFKCAGPCLCKALHSPDDYLNGHHDPIRQPNFFGIEFKDYVDLLEYEKELNIAALPKQPLIVHFTRPLYLGGTTFYEGLYGSILPVVVTDVGDMNLADRRSLEESLHRLPGKHFLKSYGVLPFDGREYLVFEDFQSDVQEPRLALNKNTWTRQKLFKNIQGLIKGLGGLDEASFMYSNIQSWNVVVVGDGGNQKLKFWFHGLGATLKQKKDHFYDLGQVLSSIIKALGFSSPETLDLINSLSDGRCDVKMLIGHPMFWLPHEKLNFIGDVHESFVDRSCPLNNATVASIEKDLRQNGHIHFDLLAKMESHNSYSVGRNKSRAGLIIRLIRNAKTHERELSESPVGNYYGKTLDGLEAYFQNLYPNLVLLLYKLVRKLCPRYILFQKYDIPFNCYN